MMTDEVSLRREMGCTGTEFARWLPGATRNAPIESSAGAGHTRHRIAVGAGTVEILLQPCPPRRIAGLEVPVLMVTFRFIDFDPRQRRAFLAYFDYYTLRGGG